MEAWSINSHDSMDDSSPCLPGLTHEAAWSWKISVGLGSTKKVVRVELLSPCVFLSSVKLDQTVSHGGTTFQEGKPWLQYLWLLINPLLATFLLMSYEPEGERNGNPLQYSCLENPVDRGAGWATLHSVAQSWTQLKQLSMYACIREGNGNPLQYSCLENPRDGGAWWAAIYGVAQVGHDWSNLTAAAA